MMKNIRVSNGRGSNRTAGKYEISSDKASDEDGDLGSFVRPNPNHIALSVNETCKEAHATPNLGFGPVEGKISLCWHRNVGSKRYSPANLASDCFCLTQRVCTIDDVDGWQ